MKFVLLVYQGSTPLPGSNRWQAMPEAEKQAIYAEYAELNKTQGITVGLPLGLPDAADGAGAGRKDPRQERDVSGRRRGRVLGVRGREHGGRDRAGCADPGGAAGRRGGDPTGREVLVINSWLRPFWSKLVDALEQHWDKMEKVPSVEGKKRP